MRLETITLLSALALLGACDADGYARTAESDRAPSPPTRAQESGSPSEDALATVSLRGRLAPLVRSRMELRVREGRTLLVVLREHDVEVCEDLGHQLREALRATGGGTRGIVVIEPGAEERVHAFLRREHLHLQVEVLPPDSLFVGARHVPTPAVLVLSGPASEAQGVAHPSRFANVRLRSFATELQPLLR
jgi:hypothetical protein